MTEFVVTLNSIEQLPEGTGDWVAFRYHLVAVPDGLAGTFQERQARRDLVRVVHISRKLLACRGWREIPAEQYRIAGLAYVRERLYSDGLAEGDAELPMLTTQLDAGRYENGPPWSLEHLRANEPFRVMKPEAKIGF